MINMFIAYDISSKYIYRVVCMTGEGADFKTDAFVVKACANAAFVYITERLVQIQGGISTTREANADLFCHRAKTYGSLLASP
ncbi:MAG: acyl-CoA/acyl-ACP dehydrogenase [Deltaproteobacteria bacterium]|nr:acyl-CoA/acyl-ACP dehydrogenase [Deltaproteobacteria bacterium]